jgi:hypothetical protein
VFVKFFFDGAPLLQESPMDNLLERIANIRFADPVMQEHSELGRQCLRELGQMQPPSRFTTLQDQIQEMRDALAAGKAPPSWAAWWENRKVAFELS